MIRDSKHREQILGSLSCKSSMEINWVPFIMISIAFYSEDLEEIVGNDIAPFEIFEKTR